MQRLRMTLVFNNPFEKHAVTFSDALVLLKRSLQQKYKRLQMNINSSVANKFHSHSLKLLI
jgi:hypothetical protein